jgi:kynurenine formamidase
LNIRRLSTEELGEIYILPEKPEIKKSILWLIKMKDEELVNVDRMNSTHKSESKLILLKSGTIRNLLNSYESKEFKKYIDTFTEEDISYLIASYIKKLGIENINTDLRDLKIGTIHDK